MFSIEDDEFEYDDEYYSDDDDDFPATILAHTDKDAPEAGRESPAD